MKNPGPDEVYDALVSFLDTFGVKPSQCARNGIRIDSGTVVIDVFATDENGSKIPVGNEALRHTYTFPFNPYVPASR